MISRLRFSHKVFLLIALPLICQLAFGLGFYGLVKQAESEAIVEHKGRDILSHCNHLITAFIGSTRALLSLTQAGNLNALNEYRQAVYEVPLHFQELKRLYADTPAVVDKLNKLEKISEEGMGIVIHGMEQMLAGDKLGGLATFNSIRPTLEKMSAQVEIVAAHGQRLQDDSVSKQVSQRQRMQSFLLIGVILNVMLAILVALAFGRTTIARLSKLLDNTLRLAQGRPLLAPSQGADEIADLDKTFHEMAQAITAENEKERAVLAEITGVMESLPVGLFMIDESGTLLRTNQTLLKMLGASGDLPAASITDLFDPRVEIEPGGSGNDLRNHDANLVRLDGGALPVELSTASLDSIDGKRSLVAVLDATDKKEIERLKQRFTETISREMRKPLNSIHSYFRDLKGDENAELGADTEKQVALVDASASRLVALVNDLLDSDSATTLQKHNVQATSIIEQSRASVEQFARGHGIKIVVDAVESASLQVEADRIVQVLVNLLSNAIKFSPAGSQISISAKRTAERIRFSVADRGRGIPADQLESIFGKFEQVSADDARANKGTGLGLAICKNIVEQHGGKIGVSSEVGVGTTFWFELECDSRSLSFER